MAKNTTNALVLFLVAINPALADPTKIELIGETDRTVTYRITDPEGIREVTATYSATGGNEFVVTYRNCPKVVTVTVSKKDTDALGEGLHELDQGASFTSLIVEDCTSILPDKTHNEVAGFDVIEEGSVQLEDVPWILQKAPPEPAKTPGWWHVFIVVLLTGWLILTLYLLWWRMFGPFQHR